MKQRIAIVTTKQPSTNPRMRKNADALSHAGYDVLVLYAYNTLWADQADTALFVERDWKRHRMGGHPQLEKWVYFIQRVTRKWATWTGQTDLQFCPSVKAYKKALQKFKPDLVIGHNPGALPVLTQWKKNTGGTILFDAEDYHCGENPEGSPEQIRMMGFEDHHLNQLDRMTAASPLIAAAYHKRFPHINISVVSNAFESQWQPSFRAITSTPLKLVWFSQVIGLDRGLLEFFKGLSGLSETPLEITLIGTCDNPTKATLKQALASDLHRLQWLPPCAEPELMKEVSKHHIGLALEPGFSQNNQIAQSNKLFTYPLCGCWTLASQTPAQGQFFEEFPALGEVLDLNNGHQWAERLKALAGSLDVLNHQRRVAWNEAKSHLNWETESKKLLNVVTELLTE